MNPKIILLVEDNPDDQELIRLALEESRIANELVILDDGVQALNYLTGAGNYAGRDLSIMPQVVLLDLKLPKVNGLEVLERLRANPRTALLPVVILTSSSEEEDMIASYQLHANSYVRKPVDFNHFAEAVKQLGLYWLLLNEAPPAQE
jgi:CheY-like chemotaxis protein